MKKISNHILGNVRAYTWILLGFLCLILLLFIYLSEDKEFHIHADFKVIINSESINFSEDQYQSMGFDYLHETVHLHDFNGDVIHFHAKGINLSVFFNSLNLSLSDSCFLYDTISYCNNETHILNFYINEKKVDSISSYVAEDLDRILIVYDGISVDTDKYLNLVTDKACIESALCPERGEPSEGSCVTGETCIVDINTIK